MKKSRVTESQIMTIPKAAEGGVAVAQLARKYGISAATYYHWKSKYAGAGVAELKRLRKLEAENIKLKRMNKASALNFMRDTLYGGRVFRTSNVVDEAGRGPLGIYIALKDPGSTDDCLC